MLSTTVRFYLTDGLSLTALVTLLRITWRLGQFKQMIESRFKSDDQRFQNIETKFSEQDADIRELRVYRQGRR